MLIDANHPFFRPIWVRFLCVVCPLLWAGFEGATGSIFWAILFGAVGIYAAMALFMKRKEQS